MTALWSGESESLGACEVDDRGGSLNMGDRPTGAGSALAGAPSLRFPRRALAWPLIGGAIAAAVGLAVMLGAFDVDSDSPDTGTTAKAPGMTMAGTTEVAAADVQLAAADPNDIVIRQVVTTVSPQGLYLTEDEPAYGFLCQSVEHVQWIDPESGARIEHTVPTQEIMLWPVAYD